VYDTTSRAKLKRMADQNQPKSKIQGKINYTETQFTIQ